jgi:hypothetical protein
MTMKLFLDVREKEGPRIKDGGVVDGGLCGVVAQGEKGES